MGYKQTFEIIIKDIQDIEKLVGNFKNYSRVPNIELDLALSKLRNVYDLMLLFREPGEQTEAPGGNMEFAGDIPVSEKEVPPQTIIPPPENNPAAAPTAGNPPQQKSNPVPEENAGEAKRNIPHNEKPAAKEVQEDTAPKQEDLNQQNAEGKNPPEKPAENINLSPDQVAAREKEQIKKERIIAEQFEKRKDFINERLGEKNAKSDLSSKLQESPIEKIAGSMGINDKFFFIRELFGGDAEKFRSTMDVLDHSASFDAAWNFLDKEFNWDMESSSVRQLLNLVRRKFISGKNG